MSKTGIYAQLVILAAALSSVACDSDSSDSCPASWTTVEGRCVDPLHVYEPLESVVADSVVGPADELQRLDLAPAPRAGFRLVVPPLEIGPFEESVICYSWQLPELPYDNIYVAELHTTPGLHHGNLIGVPINKELGPNPSPGCREGAEDFVNAYSQAFIGASDVPQVLFASSTQVVGTERRVFPDGMAMRLGNEMEAVIGVHYLNPGPDPIRVEIAYDFYVAPNEVVETEVVPFAFFYNDFTIPARQQKTLTADCAFPNGGNIVSVMPHMHEHGHAFRIERSGGDRDGEVIYEQIGYDEESDIETFASPVALQPGEGVRYHCEFDNDEDVDIHEGIGVNEMCILLGYMYPPFSQVSGFIPDEATPCLSLPMGEWLHGDR